MSKTKIVIVSLKEIVYTAIFVALGILLIVLLVFMFMPDKKQNADQSADASVYVPGVYTTQLSLGDTQVNMEVVVDKNHINSVALVNIDETVTTMYPLVKPAVNTISEQLSAGKTLDEIELDENSKYTQTLLVEAIETALDKAEVKNEK